MTNPRNVGAAGRALRATLTAFATLLLVTCTDNPSAPGRAGVGQIRVYPSFDASARTVPLALDNVRILVIRPPNDTIKTVTRSFPANQNQIQVTTTDIPLNSQSEELIIVIELYSGTTLLFSGTDTLTVQAGITPAAEALPVTYAGPGSNLDSLDMAPRDTTVAPGAQVDFTVQAFAAGSPVPTFYVSWSAATGAITPTGSYTAPNTPGTYLIHAVSPQTSSSPNGVRDSTTITVAVLVPGRTWTGAVSTDWQTAGNWSPAQVPTNADDVVIPSGTPNAPQLSTSCSAKSLTVNTGASLSTNAVNCQVLGNVFADGAITGTGAIQISTAAQVRGSIAVLQLSGPVTAVGALNVSGTLTVTGSGGSFRVNGQVVTISANLQVQGGARLVMLNSADAVSVAGNASFSGGFELDSLDAGTLSIAGNLTQAAGTTGDTYHTSGTHQTIFTGNNPTITFANPGDIPGTSHFQNFRWTGTGTLTLGSDVFAHVALTTTSTSPLTISSAAGRLLQLGSVVTAGPVTFNNVRLGLNEPSGGPLALNNVTFQGLASTAIQLTVLHPGTGGPFSFNALTFSVTPTGAGRYISATDADGATPTALTINVTNSTPASSGGLVTVGNGAVINWPSVPTPVWTGTTNTDWSVGTNWSTGVVPSGTDSVVIPIVANLPMLTANVSVGAVNVTSGTLTLNGRILTVARTFATIGSGTLTMTNLLDSLRVGGNANFGGGNETNLLSAGVITIGGNLNQTGNAGSFAATGTHGTIFTGAPTITFANPGTGVGFSHFQELGLLRPSALILASNVVVEGNPHGFGIGTLTILGSGQSLTLRGNGGGGGGGQDSGAVVFNNVRLIIDQVSSTIDTLDDFVFQGLPSTATQLTIRHPGGATPLGIRNVSFSPVPTTGFYISATDVNTSDGVPLVVDVINGSPTSGGSFVQVAGGATVNWPANPTPIWDGSQGNSVWRDPANWSTNLVPGPSDSVVIPNVPFQPVLAQDETVGAVNVSGGDIGLFGRTLTVARTFATTGIGTLTMHTNDQVFVGGNAFFGGANGGVLDGGFLEIAGNFTQTAPGAANFSATCNHQTRFTNPAPTISFATPGKGPTLSHFGTLLGTFGQAFTLGSSVTVECLINGGDGFGGVIKGGGTTTLTAQQIFSGGMTLDGVQLVMDDPTGTGFGVSNIDFVNQPTSAVQLTVIHPGFPQATAYSLSNINWTPLTSPDAGFYVSAVDPDGGSLATLIVDIFGNNPGNGPSFTKTDGTAIVTWQGAPIQWSGVQDDSWTNPANWVGGLAPTGSDDAQIPGGTPFEPRVTGTQTVKNLTVLSGATLVINDATLQVNGSVIADGSITEVGGGNLSLLGAGQSIRGNVGFVSVEASGGYNLSGFTTADNVGVSGVLSPNGNILLVTGDLSTSGAGTLAMTSPSDQVVVGGNVQFGGGSTVGLMTDGSLSVGGSFIQSNFTSTSSFFASGNHVVQLTGATPQIVNLAGAGSGSQFSTLIVGPGGMTAQTDLQFLQNLATGAGPINMNGHTFNVSGGFTTSGTGTLVMQSAADLLNVTGVAVFAGGSTTGLMTNGILTVGAGLSQLNAVSTTSFAPSALHKTVVGITGSISFQTPGTGAAGSHFNALDVTPATGGLVFTTAAFVDSALIASVGAGAPKISSTIGAPLTAKQWQIQGMTVDHLQMVLNEGAAILPQVFNGVTFQGFPTTATSEILINVTAAGASLAPRPLQFNTTTLQQTFGAGAGVYVRVASSNSQGLNLIMAGSNDPTGGFSRSQPIAPATIQYQ